MSLLPIQMNPEGHGVDDGCSPMYFKCCLVIPSHYTVPYDQVSFSDLNIYPHPRTIKVQAGESIDLNARRLTFDDLKSGGLSPDFLRDE